MRADSLVLASLHEWLREQGVECHLNLSFQVGRPCWGGLPNISLRQPRVLIRINRGLLQVWVTDSDTTMTINRPTYQLELANPQLDQRLLAILRELLAQNTTTSYAKA